MNPEELRLLEEANRARLLAAQQAAQAKKPAAGPNTFDAALAYDPAKLQGLQNNQSKNITDQMKVLNSQGMINPVTGTKSRVDRNMDGSIVDPLAPKGMDWINAYGPSRPEVAQRQAALDGGTMGAALAGGNAVAQLKAQQIADGTRGPADNTTQSNFGQVSTNPTTGERIAYDKQGNLVGSSVPNKQPVSPWGPATPQQAPTSQSVTASPTQAPQPSVPVPLTANITASQAAAEQPTVASLIYRQPVQPVTSWDRPYSPGRSEPLFVPSNVPQPTPDFNPIQPPGVNRIPTTTTATDYLNLAKSAFGIDLPTVPMFPTNTGQKVAKDRRNKPTLAASSPPKLFK